MTPGPGGPGVIRGGGGQQREWGSWREGVKVDLQWGQVAKTVEALPGVGRLGGVPSTYPPGSGPWDEWDSWKGGPPCGRWSGSRDRWGHRPSLRSGGRTEASSNDQNGAGRGRCGMTVVAVVRLGQLEGEGNHKHLVGRLGQVDLLYHPAPEEASGQG